MTKRSIRELLVAGMQRYLGRKMSPYEYAKAIEQETDHIAIPAESKVIEVENERWVQAWVRMEEAA